jgi:hypothetical protein
MTQGWNPDPFGRFELRWWDGNQWTSNVSRQGQLLNDPPTPTLPATDPSAAGGLAASPTSPTTWNRFRSLPLTGQIAVWCGAGFAAFVLLGVAGMNADPDPATGVAPTTVESSTSIETSAQPAPSTTAPPPELSGEERAIADGMVALCIDGGFSDNTDFRATCSGGDGIDHWLGGFGECNDGRIVPMDIDASCRNNDGFRTVLPANFKPLAASSDVARCNDGTFSDNTDFNGTCSSAQGVDSWLASYGECTDGTLIEMSSSASCEEFGFARLRPDYSPPTTTAAPTTTTTTTTIYVLTQEEELEIARIAFQIVFDEGRMSLAQILDSVDGLEVDRLVYDDEAGSIILELSTEFETSEFGWELTKAMAQLWSDSDGFWYLPVWSPGLTLSINGQQHDCSGAIMVEFGSFRAGQEGWETFC